VEAISKQLTWTDRPGEVYITREHFSNLQRAALRGAEALATILDFNQGLGIEDVRVLIRKSYTWGAALVSLIPRTKIEQPASPDGDSRLLTMGHTELYSPVRLQA
jgi:hypothetical protein